MLFLVTSPDYLPFTCTGEDGAPGNYPRVEAADTHHAVLPWNRTAEAKGLPVQVLCWPWPMRSPDGKVHINIYFRVQINSLFDDCFVINWWTHFLWSLTSCLSLWGLSVHAMFIPFSWNMVLPVICIRFLPGEAGREKASYLSRICHMKLGNFYNCTKYVLTYGVVVVLPRLGILVSGSRATLWAQQ